MEFLPIVERERVCILIKALIFNIKKRSNQPLA